MMERGRLRQRISQMFRGTLRSSCSITTQNVAEAVQEPVFVSQRYTGDDDDDDVLRGVDRSLSLPPPPREPLFHKHRHETAAGAPRLLVDCSCRENTATRESLKKARKKERRMSEIGAFYEAGGDGEGRTCPPASPVSPSYYCFKQMKEEQEREEKRLAAKKKKEKEKEKERRKGKKLLSNSYGFTSSSSEESDNDDVGDFFSSDEGGGAPRDGILSKEKERDTEVLFSSRSISSDSSEFYYHPSRRYSRRKKTSRLQQKPRRGDGRRSRHNSWDGGFRPLVSICSSSSTSNAGATRMNEDAAAMLMDEEEAEIAREGFAVEKQSSDPYADFRSSMLEMIVEKQMFGARDLEHLLRCYLVLNSPCHHAIILEVFSEICETLFSN